MRHFDVKNDHTGETFVPFTQQRFKLHLEYTDTAGFGVSTTNGGQFSACLISVTSRHFPVDAKDHHRVNKSLFFFGILLWTPEAAVAGWKAAA